MGINCLWDKKPVVRVSTCYRASKFAYSLDHLARLWAIGNDIAETNKLIDVFALSICEESIKRNQVTVDVGDDRDTHLVHP